MDNSIVVCLSCNSLDVRPILMSAENMNIYHSYAMFNVEAIVQKNSFEMNI